MKFVTAAIVFLIALGFGPDPAHAEDATHAQKLVEQLELYRRAQDCLEPEKLCKIMRRKAIRAGCYPPIVTWSSYVGEPEVVRARVTVAASGKVEAVELLQASRFKNLDQAVVDSMTACQLAVLERDGVAVGSRFEVEWAMHPDKTIMSLK